uniref:helix-turn-helix domain-containing protein n=1 Tax=Selenomonas sp. TAMA-11512 TaxID=3095337 RepID=UPI00403EFDD5
MARTSAGLTQAEVHRRLGIPIATLSQWESGRTKPALYIITLLKEWYERNSK